MNVDTFVAAACSEVAQHRAAKQQRRVLEAEQAELVQMRQEPIDLLVATCPNLQMMQQCLLHMPKDCPDCNAYGQRHLWLV